MSNLQLQHKQLCWKLYELCSLITTQMKIFLQHTLSSPSQLCDDELLATKTDTKRIASEIIIVYCSKNKIGITSQDFLVTRLVCAREWRSSLPLFWEIMIWVLLQSLLFTPRTFLLMPVDWLFSSLNCCSHNSCFKTFSCLHMTSSLN